MSEWSNEVYQVGECQSHYIEYNKECCWGTKEREHCTCGGDPTKCNFYPEKKKERKQYLNTARMWLQAQKDGKTYKSDCLYYNKKT